MLPTKTFSLEAIVGVVESLEIRLEILLTTADIGADRVTCIGLALPAAKGRELIKRQILANRGQADTANTEDRAGACERTGQRRRNAMPRPGHVITFHQQLSSLHVSSLPGGVVLCRN